MSALRLHSVPVPLRILLWLLALVSALPAAPMDLSRMSDADFKTFVTGTAWEFRNGAEKRRISIITPEIVLYHRLEEKGQKSASSFSAKVTAKGILTFYYGADDKHPFEVKFASDLKSASIQDSKAKGAWKATPAGPIEFPAAPDMTPAAFQSWLNGKTIRNPGENANEFRFSSGPTVTIKSRNDTFEQPFTMVRPGLIVFYWKGKPHDANVMAFAPDLTSAQFWAWWGTCDCSMGGSNPPAPPPAVVRKIPFSPPATVKTGPVTMNGLKAIPMAKTSATIHALLVQELGNSKFAGKASTLSLSALLKEGEKPATIAFNQSVGSMMQTALQEVARFQAIRHGGWPRAAEMQLSFADKFGGKDGPSAAVACALLLESAIAGTAIDPSFAVTGDMNADGSVQPIGGVQAKLRGATNDKCTLFGIPAGNVAHATDLVLTDGPSPLLGIQVFSLSTFDEALALARMDKSADLMAAIADFAALSRSAAGATQSLRTPAIQERLRAIVQRVPNHLSARLLYLYGTGTLPKSLSPAGTMAELDQSIGDLEAAIGSDLSATTRLDGGQISRARNALQRLRPLADPRVRPLIDAWVNWGTFADTVVRAGGQITPKNVDQWRTTISRISVEDQKLRTDSSFREDLK